MAYPVKQSLQKEHFACAGWVAVALAVAADSVAVPVVVPTEAAAVTEQTAIVARTYSGQP